MDNQLIANSSQSFDSDHDLHVSVPNTAEFELHDDDRLKQEDDYRQGTYRCSLSTVDP
jgi:hypothetical protein